MRMISCLAQHLFNSIYRYLRAAFAERDAEEARFVISIERKPESKQPIQYLLDSYEAIKKQGGI